MIPVNKTNDFDHLCFLRTKNKSQLYDGSSKISSDNNDAKKGAIAPFLLKHGGG